MDMEMEGGGRARRGGHFISCTNVFANQLCAAFVGTGDRRRRKGHGASAVCMKIVETSKTTTTTPEPTTRYICDVSDESADCVCPTGCTACRSRIGDVTDVVCNQCKNEFEKVGSACAKEISCDAGKVVTPPRLNGESCKCADSNCRSCDRTAAFSFGDLVVASLETCKACQNGFYLHEGQCVAQCPTSLASMGSGEFKRRCVQPFQCSNGVIREFDGTARDVNYGCKCPVADNSKASATCSDCNFLSGGFGQQCKRCKSRKLLHNGECRDSCDGLNGLATYRPGNAGGECREPFVCSHGISDTDGSECNCNKEARESCNRCSIDGKTATCIECDATSTKSIVVDGQCKKNCPKATHDLHCFGLDEGDTCSCIKK
jgi:hypothetical protein